jgi:hypothetical protein
MGADQPPGGPTRRRPPLVTPMWLAHHYPDDYDRCVRIGWRHICRRCLVLYPLAFVVMAGTFGWRPPSVVDLVLVAALPAPMVVEFVVEHLGRIRYAPARQVALSALGAIGLGRGFARYLAEGTDPLFWSVVVIYGLIGTAAAWIRHRRRARGDPSV